MSNELNPDDPYRTGNPYRGDRTDSEMRRATRVDNELQPDPELAEGRASGGKMAIFALGIAILLGVVFYGLNNTSINQASTSTPAPATAQNTSPSAPAGMRDVTPRANSEQGVTTGSAPARPQTPSPAAPANPGGANTNNANPSNAPASK
jgi:hypothetical protein